METIANKRRAFRKASIFGASKNLRAVLLVSFTLSLVGLVFNQTKSDNGATFSFTLTDGVHPENKTTFQVGEEIVIKAKLENGSSGLFHYTIQDVYYLYRFDLTKAGQALPVSYRSDKSRLLSIREEERGMGLILKPDPIFPGDVLELATMRLSDRYENLGPGSYKLNIQYKTDENAPNTTKALRLSHEVSFEIVP